MHFPHLTIWILNYSISFIQESSVESDANGHRDAVMSRHTFAMQKSNQRKAICVIRFSEVVNPSTRHNLMRFDDKARIISGTICYPSIRNKGVDFMKGMFSSVPSFFQPRFSTRLSILRHSAHLFTRSLIFFFVLLYFFHRHRHGRRRWRWFAHAERRYSFSDALTQSQY